MPWNAVLPSVKTSSGWVRSYPSHPPKAPTSGLIWGVEADALRGLGMVDGDSVSTVACIGSGGNATQTGTARPTYKAASLGGHDTFLFNGTSQYLIMPAAALSALQNVSSAIITAVYKVPATLPTGTRCLASWAAGVGSVGRAALYQNVVTTNVPQAGGRRLDADGFGMIQGSTGSTAGASEILTADFRWTSSDLLLYRNGDLIGSNLSFQTAGSTSNTASTAGYIGCNAAVAEFFSGEIAAVYVYSGNDTNGSKRSALHTYIHQKYGIRPWDMPGAELVSGFSRSYAEDFPTTVAVGGFVNMTTGSDLGKLNPASTGGGAAGTQTTYALSFKTATDESVTGEATGARYSSVRTTSVAAGTFAGGNSLYIHQHVAGGIPYGAKFKPLLPFGADENKTTYASYKYGIRYLPTATSTSFGGVMDLIDSPTWNSGTGEYGHPENNYFSGSYGAFIRDSDHIANPNRAGHVIRRNAVTYGAPAGLNDPHVDEMRTEPGRTQMIIHAPGTANSYSIWNDTVNPVSDPLGFVWQCGAGATPGAAEVADFEIAWVTISPWVGGKGLPDQELGGTIFQASTPLLDTDWEFATVASPISNANMWTGVGATVGNNTTTFEDASIVNVGAPHNKVINHFNAAGAYIDSANDYGMSMWAPLSASVDEASIEYDLRFTTPDAVTATNPWGRGGKLPGLCGIRPGFGNPPSGGSPSQYGWSGRGMWLVPNAGGSRTPVEWISYIYDPLQAAGQFGQNRHTLVGWEGTGGVAVGDWVTVKQYYKMNTVTVDGTNWSADGIHRMYWNGVMVYEKTNQVFRKWAAGNITHLAYDVYYGGGDATWAPSGDVNIQIDNLLIQTF